MPSRKASSSVQPASGLTQTVTSMSSFTSADSGIERLVGAGLGRAEIDRSLVVQQPFECGRRRGLFGKAERDRAGRRHGGLLLLHGRVRDVTGTPYFCQIVRGYRRGSRRHRDDHGRHRFSRCRIGVARPDRHDIRQRRRAWRTGASALIIGSNEACTASDSFRIARSMILPENSLVPPPNTHSGEGVLADARGRVAEQHVVLRVVALKPIGDEVAVARPHRGRSGR